MFACIDCHEFTGSLEEITDHALNGCGPMEGGEDAPYVPGAAEDAADWVAYYSNRPTLADELDMDYR